MTKESIEKWLAQLEKEVSKINPKFKALQEQKNVLDSQIVSVKQLLKYMSTETK